MSDQKAYPDLTLLRDPAALWPDATACPEWPFMMGQMRDERPTREQAEAALEKCIAQLHPNGQLRRAPTQAEVEGAIVYYFRKREPGEGAGSTKYDYFDAMGYEGLAKGFEKPTLAFCIVEATHLRGYLRKLDAEAEIAKENKARRDEDGLKVKVSRFEMMRGAHLAELDRLAEAEARHLQARADQMAHARCVELRRQLRLSHDDARAAARELGQPIDDLPEMRVDG